MYFIYLFKSVHQFAQSSIAQLEKTRAAQQTEIQHLQSQIQGLQVTVNTLGSFMGQLIDADQNIEMPGDIRRMVHHINQNIVATRKKPIFVDRRIGKSVSVNAQLGFPLKVLEEMNESPDGSPKNHAAAAAKGSSSFFENTFQQIREQHRIRPTRLLEASNGADIKLPDHVEKAIENMAAKKQQKEQQQQDATAPDSGIATPMSPPTVVSTATNVAAVAAPITIEQTHFSEMHPLSSCEDVNFTFNGTTQLKQIRPIHHHHNHNGRTGGTAAGGQSTETDTVKNRRS